MSRVNANCARLLRARLCQRVGGVTVETSGCPLARLGAHVIKLASSMSSFLTRPAQRHRGASLYVATLGRVAVYGKQVQLDAATSADDAEPWWSFDHSSASSKDHAALARCGACSRTSCTLRTAALPARRCNLNLDLFR